MRARRIIAIVLGIILVLPGLGMLLGGATIGVMTLSTHDAGGWYSMTVDRVESDGVAVTAERILVENAAPPVVADWLDLDVRLTARSLDGKPLFVGIADQAAIDRYLDGAAHDVVLRLPMRGTPTYSARPGAATVDPPAAQTIWDASASGAGEQQVIWTPHSGSWAATVLNADGSSGVAVTMTASVRSGVFGPIALGLIGLGLILLVIGTLLIVLPLVNARREQPRPPGSAAYGPVGTPSHALPVVVEARLDPALSQGLWLVKWFLAIPHYLVLAFLWLAVGVVSVWAWFAILITGRYPRALFDFTVGVLRWTWRVAYYAGTGGLGSDRYPPFTLDAMPDDAAHLDVAYPEELSRGLIFVKWLLLVPHWIVLAILTGPTVSWLATDRERWQTSLPGVLGLLVLAAALVLLFSGAYPKGLFDVVVGLNRWEYRVLAYALLLTDSYPPFRLDSGGSEVGSYPPPTGPPVVDSVAPDQVAGSRVH